MAHIGILRGVEEEGIPYEKIIGVSMGAFIANIYCTVPDWRFTQARCHEWLTSDVVQNSLVISYNKSINESAKSILKKK